MPRNPTIGIRFTPEDLALLEEIERTEERQRSDVVRRAIRAYAKSIGIHPKTEKRATGKS